VLDTGTLSVYVGVFAALIGAGFGLPIPEELPIVTAGVLAGHAAQDPQPALCWWLLLPLCILGVMLSDGVLYAAGRVGGVRLLAFPCVARVLPHGRLERLRHRFHRHGVFVLLLARLLPGVRTALFLTAGITRLSWKRFLLADGLYAVPGVSLLFFLAYWFTDRFRDWVVGVEEALAPWRGVLLAAVAAVAVGYLLVRQRRPLRLDRQRDTLV